MRSIMFVLLVVAAGDLACGAEAPQHASKTPAGPRIRLVSQREPLDLVAGEDDYLVFEAEASVPLAYPSPEDFRLEGMSIDVCEAMIFGASKLKTDEYIWVDKPVHKIRLSMASYHRAGQQDRMEKMMQLQRADGAVPYEVGAAANLRPGVRYRLSWIPRTAGGGQQARATCEFAIPEIPAALRAKLPAPQGDWPGMGPLYICEILFRHQGTLFYARDYLPKRTPRDFGLPTVGFQNGEYVSPPPGRGLSRQLALRVQRAFSPTVKPLPEPAESSQWLGARVAYKDAHRPSSIEIHSGCFGGRIKVPTKPAEPVWYVGNGGIFRFELLDRNVEGLRQDPDFWRQRTGRIHEEVMALHRPAGFYQYRGLALEIPHVYPSHVVGRLNQSEICTAAVVLQDPKLLTYVRDRVRTWMKEKAPDWKSQRQGEFPDECLFALADVGSATDVPLLMEMQELVEDPRLNNHCLRFARQAGAKAARPLLVKMVTDDVLHPFGGMYWESFRKFEPQVPSRCLGDEFMADMCSTFGLKPAEFGLEGFEPRMLAMHEAGRMRLTEAQLKEVTYRAKPGGQAMLFFPSVEARKTGRAKMIKWIDEEMQATIDRQKRTD